MYFYMYVQHATGRVNTQTEVCETCFKSAVRVLCFNLVHYFESFECFVNVIANERFRSNCNI